MSTLRAEPRADKTGKIVTRHVRDVPATPAASQKKLAAAAPSIATSKKASHRTHFSEFDPAAEPAEGYVAPSKTEKREGTTRSTVGSKFNGYRDIADIKKDVVADLKEAVDAGYLPDGIKISLKTGRAARVQNLSARIEGLPDDVIYSGEKTNWGGPEYSELASMLSERVMNIIGAYDSSYSDWQSDGGGCVYYSGVSIIDAEQRDWEIQQAANRRRAREERIERSLS